MNFSILNFILLIILAYKYIKFNCEYLLFDKNALHCR